jgi:hypothetical protein
MISDIPYSVADPGCVSRIRIFSILDPGSEFFHPGSASNNSSILAPKNWFLSSRKYDTGCSSRIRIPDPRSRGQKGSGSRIRIRNSAGIYRTSRVRRIVRRCVCVAGHAVCEGDLHGEHHSAPGHHRPHVSHQVPNSVPSTWYPKSIFTRQISRLPPRIAGVGGGGGGGGGVL